MKKVILLLNVLLIALISNAQGVHKTKTAKMYYYTVSYFAEIGRQKYEYYFQQKVITSSENPSTFIPKLTKQYVEFITKTHPEYYQWLIYGAVNQKEIDFNIHSMASIQGQFEREKDALGAMQSTMNDIQIRHDKDSNLGAPDRKSTRLNSSHANIS